MVALLESHVDGIANMILNNINDLLIKKILFLDQWERHSHLKAKTLYN